MEGQTLNHPQAAAAGTAAPLSESFPSKGKKLPGSIAFLNDDSSLPPPSHAANSKLPPIASKKAVKAREFIIGSDGRTQTPKREKLSADQLEVDDFELTRISNARSLKEASSTTEDRIKRLLVRAQKKLLVPNLLDGVTILVKTNVEHPRDAYILDVSNSQLRFVVPEDLLLFENIHTLKAGENLLPFAKLGAFPNVRRLSLPFNEISDLDLEVDGLFPLLEQLDLSYNQITHAAIIVLATLPSLKSLDLTANHITSFPIQLVNDMPRWREKVIELLLPNHVALLDATLFSRGGVGVEEGGFLEPTQPVGPPTGFSRTKPLTPIQEKPHDAMKQYVAEAAASRGNLALTEPSIQVPSTKQEPVDVAIGSESSHKEPSLSSADKQSTDTNKSNNDDIVDDEEVVTMAFDEAQVRVHTIKNNEVTETQVVEPMAAFLPLRQQTPPNQMVPVAAMPEEQEWKNEPMMPLDDVVAFEMLESLVLERNGLSSEESFKILGHLPNLKKLNLNHNRYRTLQFLSAHQEDPQSNYPPAPFLLQKYQGFYALQELRIAFNKIDTARGILGLVWLPALQYIWIEGNPVLVKFGKETVSHARLANTNNSTAVHSDALSYKDCDPLKAIPRIYGIEILDLVYQPHPSTLEDTYYTLAPVKKHAATAVITATPAHPGTLRRVTRPPAHDDDWNPVQQPSGGESPALAAAAAAAAAGTLPHQVKEAVLVKLEDLKSRRRDIKLTDEEVKETVRQGRVLTLKELKRIRKRESLEVQQQQDVLRRREEERIMYEEELEKERKRLEELLVEEKEKREAVREDGCEGTSQISQVAMDSVAEGGGDQGYINVQQITVISPQDEYEMKYDPHAQDQTFLTGVHITGGGGAGVGGGTFQVPTIEMGEEAEMHEAPSTISYITEADSSTQNPHNSNNIGNARETESFSSDSYNDTSTTDSYSLDYGQETMYPPHVLRRLHNTENNGKKMLRPTAARAAEQRREMARIHQFPRSIQASVRALRHAVTNPISYWRVMEDSYAKPTFSHTVRVRDAAAEAEEMKRAKAAAEGVRYISIANREEQQMNRYQEKVDASMGLGKQVRPDSGGKSDSSSVADANMIPESGNVSPTNTMWTTVAVRTQMDHEAAMIAASRAAKNLNATAKIAGDAKAAKAVITNMHIEIPRIKGEFKEEDALQLAKQLGEEQLRKRIIVMNEDGADEESSLHQQQQQQQQQQPSEETKSNNNDSTKGKSALILRLEKERAEEEERMRLLQEQQQQDHGYDSSEERYSSPHRKMTPAAAMALAEKRTAEYKRRTLENKKAQESRKRAGAKKIRYKDDFEEMSAMMSAVDEKIATIETNLSSILNSNIMQKHLPQSRKLINDVQAEYTRIEKMYRDSALAAIEASKAKVK